MIRLLFDIGNTRLKWALANGFTITARGSEPTELDGVASCIKEIERTLVDKGYQKVESALICSVGPKVVLSSTVSTVEERLGVVAQVVGVTASAVGVQNFYEDQSRLGVDRWVAVLGAAQESNSLATIVVDAGTAITIDYLSASQQYLGGVILPGDRLMAESLTSNTAGIIAKPVQVESVFGLNTSSCVSAGVRYGLPGAVASIVRKMMAAYPNSTQVLVSGGAGPDLVPELATLCADLPVTITSRPDLVFYGLIALCKVTA